ncbi:adenylyl-sulfate kinase [Chitinophaga filiformis]|uniref:Adenylyl-sulfate kinase n=1 Tax=Chitinophaga filiformis TaxID=104663 RepID=A0ABY4HW82_CHIFI|nr:adenylyl-sulfate kinase [Chitinophaga filiformis]UPK66806.1 adenylyl-sulfate kinase [Chitinophaga filiformis]
MIIQLCGLSGAGKTTIARNVQRKAAADGTPIEIIDGDIYRESLCRDLGFSREDRCENIRRLGFVASRLSNYGIISIISAINPYESIRQELAISYPHVKTVFIDCTVEKLIARDTKGLYKRALLPEGHPDKLNNLTGINDPFETPVQPDLHLHTDNQSIAACTNLFLQFINRSLALQQAQYASVASN